MDAESFQRLEIELEALTSAQRETVLARMHSMAERDNNQRVIEERLGKQMHRPVVVEARWSDLAKPTVSSAIAATVADAPSSP